MKKYICDCASESCGKCLHAKKHEAKERCNDTGFCSGRALDVHCIEVNSKEYFESLDPWHEHKDYTVADWQAEVAANDTRLGYQLWVMQQRESELDET